MSGNVSINPSKQVSKGSLEVFLEQKAEEKFFIFKNEAKKLLKTKDWHQKRS